jgi:hypothetical protein
VVRVCGLKLSHQSQSLSNKGKHYVNIHRSYSILPVRHRHLGRVAHPVINPLNFLRIKTP